MTRRRLTGVLAAVAALVATAGVPADGAGCAAVRRTGPWTTIDLPTALVAPPAGVTIGGQPPKPLAADPVDPRRMFYTVGRQLYRTVDGGCSWQVVLDIGTAGDPANLYRANPMYSIMQVAVPRAQYVYALLVDPTSTLTAPQPAYLASSTDGGTTWQIPQPMPAAGVDGLMPFCTQAHFTAAPSDPRIVYVHCINNAISTIFTLGLVVPTGIFVTADTGRTWRRPAAKGFLGLNTLKPDLGIDPLDPKKIWTAHGEELGEPDVIYTADGGENWVKVARPSGVGKHFLDATVRHDKGRPARILMSTTAGILESLDAGKQWRVIRPSMPPDREGPIQAAFWERGGASVFMLAAYNVGYNMVEYGGSCTQGERIARWDRVRRWRELPAPVSTPRHAVLQIRTAVAGKGYQAFTAVLYATKADCDGGQNAKTVILTYASGG